MTVRETGDREEENGSYHGGGGGAKLGIIAGVSCRTGEVGGKGQEVVTGLRHHH